MASHRPGLFHWKTFSNTGSQANTKVRLTDGDINSWMKKVEKASEFAVSEVLSSQKLHNRKPSRVVALQSVDQLQDHDDAYCEAQTILSDWMNKKLHLDLEMDEDEEEEEYAEEKHANRNHDNFNAMSSQLTQEDESFEVHQILQDLMERDIMDRATVQRLHVDVDDERKRYHDPNVTMELRHKQVKDRRAQREAERERRRREQEAQREALEEAKRLEHEEQRKKKREARRQEELLQQEVVRLRNEMQEKRSMEQLAKQREREELDKPNTVMESSRPNSNVVTHRQLVHREQGVEAKVHMVDLHCMQKHFSAWYSAVLAKRMQMGKAAALCDWRRQLRAWRAWKAVVWVRRKEREAKRTDEELRLENRRFQLAGESDRRRLLRRCLSDWRLWCRMEKERRDLLNQQEETRRKMAALIDAAASGKLTTKNCTETPITVQPESMNQSENPIQPAHVPVQRATASSTPSTLTGRTAALPTQAWQVTRRHAALSLSEAREGRRLSGAPRCQSAKICGGRFEHRHMAQQKTIAEQKRLLKEQQDVISELQERQKLMELRQVAEKAEQLAEQFKLSDLLNVIKTSIRTRGAPGQNSARRPTPKVYDGRQASPHSVVRGMEERARQRAERRKELEELKRRREEEKLAQMRAEEEVRLRQDEEEKRIAAERRKEERRQKKEREIEKQRRMELEQKMLKKAVDHYHRSLLLHKGITPWKQLVARSHANAQKAVAHHTQVLERRCLLFWLHITSETLAEKIRRADRLYERIVLRRSLYSWKMFKHLQSHLVAQAEDFYTTRTQGKVFKALQDHAIQQRLAAWDREQQADEHRARRAVSRCFAAWRRLPEALREERDREKRREQLRRYVAEILPDFRSSPLDAV